MNFWKLDNPIANICKRTENSEQNKNRQEYNMFSDISFENHFPPWKREKSKRKKRASRDQVQKLRGRKLHSVYVVYAV